MVLEDVLITDKFVSFWGSVFSNWYPSRFYADGEQWYNSEQYFMYLKAKVFNDDKIAEAIKITSEPKVCKSLGRQIEGFDEGIWEKVRYSCMYEAVMQKFAQNPDLKKILLDDELDGLKFVEGSPVDGIWGVKLMYDDPALQDENNWKGLNQLGKVLDDVRKVLKNGKK